MNHDLACLAKQKRLILKILICVFYLRKMVHCRLNDYKQKLLDTYSKENRHKKKIDIKLQCTIRKRNKHYILIDEKYLY